MPLKEEPLLNSGAEMVWDKLCINNFKPIFLCSLYRPSNNTTALISELRDSLNKLSDHNPGIINLSLLEISISLLFNGKKVWDASNRVPRMEMMSIICLLNPLMIQD